MGALPRQSEPTQLHPPCHGQPPDFTPQPWRPQTPLGHSAGVSSPQPVWRARKKESIYAYLHSREGKASYFVETRLPIFLMHAADDQPLARELRFGKEQLEFRQDGRSEPWTIALSDIRDAVPDGEVVRVTWKEGACEPAELTFLVADEELSPTARRAQCVSIAAKIARLVQRTPPW